MRQKVAKLLRGGIAAVASVGSRRGCDSVSGVQLARADFILSRLEPNKVLRSFATRSRLATLSRHDPAGERSQANKSAPASVVRSWSRQQSGDKNGVPPPRAGSARPAGSPILRPARGQLTFAVGCRRPALVGFARPPPPPAARRPPDELARLTIDSSRLQLDLQIPSNELGARGQVQAASWATGVPVENVSRPAVIVGGRIFSTNRAKRRLGAPNRDWRAEPS